MSNDTAGPKWTPETKALSIDAVEIHGAPGLDPIQVLWYNAEPGRGSVTITCWGCAWTCYFGAMSGLTIQEFFAGCDTYYLTTKLGITPHLYQRKRDHAYLGKIIDAVKDSLRKARGEEPTADKGRA